MKRDGIDSIKEKLFFRKSTIITYLCPQNGDYTSEPMIILVKVRYY